MSKKYNKRVTSVYFFFLILFIGIGLRIFYLQIFKRNFFQSLAQNQRYRLINLQGRRGDIVDRQKRVLATGISCYSIFADPALVEKLDLTAEIISANLNLSKESLLSKLKRKKRFVWIKRKISWSDKEKIKAHNLAGIGFVREEKRFYPQDGLAAAAIGIANIDNKGLEGLELAYEDYLRGKDGWVRILQDSASRQIILSSQIITPQAGADITLSLDAQIQYWAEKYLKNTIKENNAVSGGVVIMDASNGEVLALANYPGFNPNELGNILPQRLRNHVVSDMFEPGSVFKVATLLAAVNENKISNDDKFFCENGSFKIPGTILHDWKPYGELTFKEVFMKSSNIGVAKIVQSLGRGVFFGYLKRLGFGRLSGIDLPGEAKGLIKPINKWSKTSAYIVPMGQEVGVNLLQLVRAFAVVANGGYLVKPHLVKSICSQGFCEESALKSKKRIFPKSIADRAKDILIAVVKDGTGKRAQVKGRKIGGKTGTAQKYDSKLKRYSSSKYRATFIGFIADLNPPVVIGITVDEPKRSHFGGVVAAPIFKNIAQKIIKYMERAEN